MRGPQTRGQGRLATARELGRFLWTRDRLWLLPIVLLVLVVAVLLVAEASSPYSLFLYPL